VFFSASLLSTLTLPKAPQGNTETIKIQMGAQKQAWYYHAEPYRKKSHVDFTLDEIRDMFGSKRYDQKQEEEKKLKAVI